MSVDEGGSRDPDLLSRTSTLRPTRSNHPFSATFTARLTALGVVLMLITAACGSGSDGATTTVTTADADAETTTSNASSSAADGGDDAGGTGTGGTDQSSGAQTDDQSDDEVGLPVAGEQSSTTSASTTDVPAPSQPDQAPLPNSADGLAAALNEAEGALREPNIGQETAAPWGRRQQALYQLLWANPDWVEPTLAAIDPTVASAVEHNWTARQTLSALVNSENLSPTLPAWRIDPPAPAEELLGYYREASDATGVPWEVLAAINLVETRMGRINGISSAGAVGPMQFLPTTWEECCSGDPTDPHDAIVGAATYLVRRGAETDLDRAIFGYNNSDYYVTAVQAYAAVMAEDANAYFGYHAWQVFYLSAAGLAVLPEGYIETEPVDAATWLTANPASHFPG